MKLVSLFDFLSGLCTNRAHWRSIDTVHIGDIGPAPCLKNRKTESLNNLTRL